MSCTQGCYEKRICSGCVVDGSPTQQDTPLALPAYLAKDNQTILDNLIETLEEIGDVKFSAYAATLADATSWLTILGGSWHLATADLFFK